MHGPSRLYVTPNEENNWLESESISVGTRCVTMLLYVCKMKENVAERKRKWKVTIDVENGSFWP